MCGFCLFWHISPREYDQITLAEQSAMFEHMERVTEQRRKAADKARNRSRSGRGRGRRR